MHRLDQLIPQSLFIFFIVFWLWMFYEMVNNHEMQGNERLYWLIGFVFLSILTAGYYFFTVYTKE